MEFIFVDKNVIMTKEGDKLPLHEILLNFVNVVDNQNISSLSNKYLIELINGYFELNKTFKHLQGVMNLIYPAYQNYLKEIYAITEEMLELDEKAKELLEKEINESHIELEQLRNEVIDLMQTFFLDKSFPANYGGIDIEIVLRVAFIAKEKQVFESYVIHDIEKYCFFTISELFNSGMTINKCHNCGKYFVPLTRNDEIYCDNEYSNGRTCKQIGYENKIKNDDILKEYRRVYKNKNAYKQRTKNKNPNAEAEFKKWVYAAKLKLDDCREGIITLEEFKNWLENN